MKESLDKQLCHDFPLLFADRNASPRVSCMYWGFPGDGWYGIIREAAEKLEPLIIAYRKENPGKDFPRAAQVKEKFGTMRFYMNFQIDEMDKIISRLEGKSAETCENCGKKGRLRKGGWLRTLCNRCHKQNG